MNILKTYLKLIIVRNKFNYLMVILSILASYLLISLVMVFVDNILILSKDVTGPDLSHIYIGIRSVFVLAGFSLIFSQCYNIMKSSLREYCILKTLGATRSNIRILISIQTLTLVILTVPLGFYGGHLITGIILDVLAAYSLNNDTKEMVNSVSTLLLVVGIVCAFIFILGAYLERGIRKMPLTNILSDNLTFGKET